MVATMVLSSCGPAVTTVAPATNVPGTTAVPSTAVPTQSAADIAGSLPRNETLYFNGQQWGSVVGWNPYSSSMNNAMAVGAKDAARVIMFETLYLYDMLDGIKAAVSADTTVEYNSFGRFDHDADIGIVVVGEQPYAEGVGDASNLRLSNADISTLTNVRERVNKLIVVILSGRPLVITEQLPLADAWVAAWLPGTEGAGIADVLFGDYPFTGKLPYTWPRTNEQLPININNAGDRTGCAGSLFPFGYGLEFGEDTPEILDCK